MNRFGSNRKSSGLRVYSNLANRRKTKSDAKSRRKAEYLATLPKHPVKRFFYKLHPKRLAAFWFSRDGAQLALKIVGVSAIVLAILVGGLFAYYRRELSAISPQELSKRVATTVTRYYDRNDVLLWEDKGDGDYKLVVESNEISKYMKQATVAIEDKNFYKHAGVSPTGMIRAAVNNFSGGDTQGGSTLTQQLIKQVFFADQAGQRGLNGVPRKIKEVILAIEVERMYNKDQILTLYLNESPYGGRRNGVESAAQTYFGKPAKELNLAESALLASIPQQPGTYDPYNVEGHKGLIARQHQVLDNMAEQGYISKKEAEDAKKVAVLDTIRSESNIPAKAPHFVRMVQAQLEAELGKATVGRGGLTVKTTLDYRAQELVEKSITDLFNQDPRNANSPERANYNNAAATIVDVPTGQILAMQGSRDYNFPGYGNVNATEAFIQPGSSVKPFVYAALFREKPETNYGAGTILSDEPLSQSVYRTSDGTTVQNFDNKFRGKIPVRSALAESRNIPAIKAMYLNDQANGDGDTVKLIQSLGDLSYCTDGVDKTVGLGASIGSCGLKQYEHANTFATMARNGVYKPVASVLEVKNAQNQVLKSWKDDQAKQVIDPQITYIISDILSDDAARAPSFGRGAVGLNVPGVKTATKTGTSNIGDKSKDLWMNSYSTKAALSMWVGNNDATPMSQALSSVLGPTVGKIMEPLHKDVFAKDGTWKSGDWFQKPDGVQTLNVNGRNDLFPSWYKKSQSSSSASTATFDRVSKKKATDCTPAGAKIDVQVTTYKDPITGKQTTTASDGYDNSAEDDVHKCNDVKPFVTAKADKTGTNQIKITATVNQGTFGLQSIEFKVNGTVVKSQPISSPGTYDYEGPATGEASYTVTVVDTGYYDAAFSGSKSVASSGGSSTQSVIGRRSWPNLRSNSN